MNFLLVHGAWHGGWCWRDVAENLRAAGHHVWTPTMTGLGERAHLLNADVGLSTCIEDICAVIEAEELTELVLVGHSFAGPVISGVADRLSHRLQQLIYLDALIVQSGQSAISIFPPQVQQERSRTIDAEGLRMAIPSADKFGVSQTDQVDWLARRLTPHPLKSYTETLQLEHPLGNGLPQPALVAACLSTLAKRGLPASKSMRYWYGSLPAALAISSMKLSLANAFMLWLTARQ